MKFARALLLTAFVLIGFACASSGGSTGHPNVITAADVENAGATYNDA